MARFIMEDLVKKAGLEERIKVDSAATSTEEIGNPVYPPARRKLAEYGIGCQGHAAKQMKKADYSDYDLLSGMDQANLWGGPGGKDPSADGLYGSSRPGGRPLVHRRF